MFLFSGRGYWQELIETIIWYHNVLRFTPVVYPRALSITQGRAVGVTHYLLGGIGTTWEQFWLAVDVTIHEWSALSGEGCYLNAMPCAARE